MPDYHVILIAGSDDEGVLSVKFSPEEMILNGCMPCDLVVLSRSDVVVALPR